MRKHSVRLLLTGLLLSGVGCASGGHSGSEGSQEPSERVELGFLTCKYVRGTNSVFRTDRDFACRFKSALDGPSHLYSAEVSKVGIDLLAIKKKTMHWIVLASSFSDDPGILVGDYGGVSVDAAVGLGLGGDILIGGANDSVTLQPAVISQSDAWGAAIGFKRLSLAYAGPYTPQHSAGIQGAAYPPEYWEK